MPTCISHYFCTFLQLTPHIICICPYVQFINSVILGAPITMTSWLAWWPIKELPTKTLTMGSGSVQAVHGLFPYWFHHIMLVVAHEGNALNISTAAVLARHSMIALHSGSKTNKQFLIRQNVKCLPNSELQVYKHLTSHKSVAHNEPKWDSKQLDCLWSCQWFLIYC